MIVMPFQNDVLNVSTVFSAIDINTGYHQVSVGDSHKCRTAFTVGHLCFYKYNKMPFGLSNSPATYQRLIKKVQIGNGQEMAQSE